MAQSNGEETQVMPHSPKKIAIVALGPSCFSWAGHRLSRNAENQEYDEIWTVNRGARVFAHDLVFVMDDLLGEEKLDPAYAEFLKRHDRPIMTSRVYDSYPQAWEYPLEAVVSHIGGQHCYFHNSIPYMLAYADYIGVNEITLFGCDYTDDKGNIREEDRANTEYWVGVLRARHIKIGIAETSTLCNQKKQGWFYGYHDQRYAQELYTAAIERPRLVADG